MSTENGNPLGISIGILFLSFYVRLVTAKTRENFERELGK